MTPANALTNQIRAATSKIGARLFPMTVGRFYGPFHRGVRYSRTQTITVQPGDVLIRQGHVVNIGTKGMPDLVGFTPHVVTAEDVGKTLSIYTAPEVKAGADTVKPEQQAFIDFVNKNGGRAGIARTPEDAVRICRGQAGE